MSRVNGCQLVSLDPRPLGSGRCLDGRPGTLTDLAERAFGRGAKLVGRGLSLAGGCGELVEIDDPGP